MERSIKNIGVFCLITLGLSVFSCKKESHTPTPGSTAHHKYISMQNMSFDPETLTVSEGDTVTWINTESIAHTVTSGTASGTTPHPDGKFDSGNMNKSDKFTVVFSSAKGLGVGTYPYYCIYHLPDMKGSIIVQ